jgi:hypothetical protein
MTAGAVLDSAAARVPSCGRFVCAIRSTLSQRVRHVRHFVKIACFFSVFLNFVVEST